MFQALAGRRGPERLLDLALRGGPHGDRFGLKPGGLNLDKVMAAPVERPRGASFLARPRFRGEIQFRDVVFRYPDRTLDALDGVSFTIRAGDRVGVIGRVGSGKSTLAKLLVGLYEPQSGGIVMDGTDLRQIDPADLRRNIGYLPQSVVLFSGSVRENLALGAPLASDEAILRAARLAGLEEAIGRNPQGYDLAVGERGEALSGGQRQRVAIARALLARPPLLLCDEPTGNLSSKAGEEVVALLRTVCTSLGASILLVTHNPRDAAAGDRVLFLHDGALRTAAELTGGPFVVTDVFRRLEELGI